MSGPSWTADQLRLLDAAVELEIAVERADGSSGRWTPIWVVTTGGAAYVRTWHRRDTGWYGHALRSRQAAIRVPGLVSDVTVVDVADTSPAVTAAVDDAYRAKYAAGAASMVTPGSAQSTLRLDRA